MRKTGSGLASVVVKLHQTEDQVRRHELEFVRWVCDNVTGKRGRKKEKKRKEKENRFRFTLKISFRAVSSGKFS